MSIFDRRVETMPRDQMVELQLNRMRKMVDYCMENVPFYTRRLSDAGIHSGSDIQSLKDIEKIPFTTKDDLRDNYPDGFLAVPRNKIARIHASSGTTGKPTLGYYTKQDMRTWAEASARVLCLNNIETDDVLQISVGYGLFTGALGFHQGAELIGCTIVPASTGNTQKQLVMLHDVGVTALMATPSYATYLADLINQSSVSRTEYKIAKVLLGAERCTNSMRNTIEKKLGVPTFDNYGLTECFGPGVAGECECHCGMHISEDLFYPEIINPESGEALSEGEEGELVFTSLYREAMIISGLPVIEGILLFLLFETLCLCWTLMNCIGLLRDYKQITFAFILALVIASVLLLFIYLVGLLSLPTMIVLLLVAYSAVDIFLFRCFYQGFPVASTSVSVFHFFYWFKTYPSLAIVSFTTQVALLGHFWVTWFTSTESVIHKGLFASCPTYDFPAIVAYFCTIPAMIYFIALFETSFYEKYRNYNNVLSGEGNTAAVSNAREDMIIVIRKGMRNFSSIQIISCLLFMTAGSKFLSVLNIGMTERMLQTFRMFCIAYSLYSIGSILMLLQMYFVNERKAVLPAVIFAVLSLAATFVDGKLYGHASGLGLCISALIYLLITAIQLVRCLEKLEYHILCENPFRVIIPQKIRPKKLLHTVQVSSHQRLITRIAFSVSLIMVAVPTITIVQNTRASMYVYRFEPVKSDKVLISPGMGYAPWANSDEGEEIETALVYVELRWADWEPTEGTYDIEFVNEEYRLDSYREQGRQVVFRFLCDNPGSEDHIDIPDWLYEATEHDGYHYDNEYGLGYSPNYTNERFIDAHAKAIEALGEAYGGDDFFCYIELGSLGHWGEYHVNISEGVPPLPNYDVRNEYIKPYLKAFPNARFMTRYPLVETIKYGFGLYNDMTGDPEETEYWISNMKDGIWEQTGLPEQADTSTSWMTQPIGGEFASTESDSFYLHDNLSVTLELLRNSHQSFIGPKIIVNETNVDYSSASRAILKTIGYRYLIPTAQVDASSDDHIVITVDVSNEGIAPIYDTYSVRLSLWDDEGSIVWTGDLSDIQLEKLLPDEIQSDSVSVSREELDDDIYYTLTAAIINERSEAVVPMAIDGEIMPREYIIGQFKIR